MTTLVFEKFGNQDFDAYYRLVGNDQVMAMITERALSKQEAATEFESMLLQNCIHEKFGHFKITDSDTGEFVGYGKLNLEHIGNHQAEIGYMLLPEFWGKGLGSKISNHLMQIARGNQITTKLQQLYAIIDPKNIASRKILEKQGFIHKEFKDFDGLPGEILVLKLNDR